jgi:transcriptional antiterminator RfaH
MKTGRNWYVVHTHSHAEATAAAHLERQGFETYYPRYLRRRSHARRITLVPAPFFPRYIFVAVDKATQRWRAIRSTLGVSYMVGGEMGPTPVADWVVEDLRRREDATGFISIETPLSLAQGDPVRLRSGPFSTHVGMFDGLIDSNRVAVLLDLLGRKIRVIFDGAAIGVA